MVHAYVAGRNGKLGAKIYLDYQRRRDRNFDGSDVGGETTLENARARGC